MTALIVPLLGALLLFGWRRWHPVAARGFATLAAALPLLVLVAAWLRFDPAGPRFQEVLDLPWIPAIGAGFRLGLDGVALAVASASALLFTVAAAYPVDDRGKTRQYLAWMLFLEAACLGLFLSLDLLLFYVCFDLSLVGMYFLIAVWGHAGRESAAIKFVLYTFAGSLVMLLGILSLALAGDAVSFDMRLLIERQPLAGTGLREGLTLLALLIGLGIKTPLVPLHTWLPPAHVEAPAPASAILAGVLLKLGTYGFVRVAYSMLTESFARYARWIAVVAVIGIVYGAFVAFGQRHIKRRIAYTSVVHMGYAILGIAVAAAGSAGAIDGRRMALTGATVEMVAHGLITGALFLITGSLWQRTHAFDMDEFGGVAARAPRLTACAVVASFASLGLPGLAGFVAEFQIFAGSLAVEPWLAGCALIGVLVTAALFLQLLQQVFLGEPSKLVLEMDDIGVVETVALGILLGATIVIGVAPAFLIEVIDATSRILVGSP